MHIDPQISALRGDHAAQRAMREAAAKTVQQCREDPALAPMLEDLKAFGEGAALAECAALAKLTHEGGAWCPVILPLIHALTELHRRFPMAQLAFRHQSGEGFHFLQIAGQGRATLGLALHDGSTACQNVKIGSFPDAERHEVVLAGAADIGMLELVADHGDRAAIDTTAQRIVSGDVLRFPTSRHSRVVQRVHGRLLVLRLARTAEKPEATRQYDLKTGRLVHRASGDRRDSRDELMMAVLGRMGRIDAASAFAAMTQSGSDHLRWQAVRECLALDTTTGFGALCRIAADPLDSLSAGAGALRAQLVQAHPQLLAMEAQPCRA